MKRSGKAELFLYVSTIPNFPSQMIFSTLNISKPAIPHEKFRLWRTVIFFQLKTFHDNLVRFQNPLKSLQASFDFRSFWIRSTDGVYASRVKVKNTIIPLVQISSSDLQAQFRW